jgi:2-polyprenyl-3-methyl-5-hydroxy-6-metoxy-1,4-benzoquinol methylase
MDTCAHWESVYTTKRDAELSWFQVNPRTSIELLSGLRPTPKAILDVGGGQSMLGSALLRAGAERVTVLDISPSAIDRGRSRAGTDGDRIQWLVGDVLHDREYGPVDCWHDRAVFHFLTRPSDRATYVSATARAVPCGGHAIVATFAMSGPEQCSGLPVSRYSIEGLANEFRGPFELVTSTTEQHCTPWGSLQDFVYVVLRRTSS